MDYSILGKTGLRVSKLGLGAGGPSKLGRNTGRSKPESINVVKVALDLGINVIDTAESYRTENIVGEAIKGYERSDIVISTKISTWRKLKPKKVRKSLKKSLKRLGTDYIDVYHLHAVNPSKYQYYNDEIVPTLKNLKEEGYIRHLGITEMFHSDPTHQMLHQAVKSDAWEVMMVGFNLLNQTARKFIFEKTIEKNIGVLVMFAVRRAMSRPERLEVNISKLIEKGELDKDNIDLDNPLGFLVNDNGAKSIVDAAYRFCLQEPGTHVILTGTGDPSHLKENVQSVERGPLPDALHRRLKDIFKNAQSVSGD